MGVKKGIAWWPSGKAPRSGRGDRRFESYPGSQKKIVLVAVFLINLNIDYIFPRFKMF